MTATQVSGCHDPKPILSASTPPDVIGRASALPCVYFPALQGFLPSLLPGYARLRDEGSTGKYGEVSVSEAERVFRNGEQELSVRIVDTTLAGRLGERIRFGAQKAAEAPTETDMAIVLANTVGYVRYDSSDAKAEANLLVGDRYVVALTSHGFGGTAEVRWLATQLNIAGLSKLR